MKFTFLTRVPNKKKITSKRTHTMKGSTKGKKPQVFTFDKFVDKDLKLWMLERFKNIHPQLDLIIKNINSQDAVTHMTTSDRGFTCEILGNNNKGYNIGVKIKHESISAYMVQLS